MSDYVVYVPTQDAKYHVLEVESGADSATVENLIVSKQSERGQTGLQPGETAYVVFNGENAKSKADAVSLAKAANLVFIPRTITLGMRNRIPDISMSDIRAEFSKRNKKYELEKDFDQMYDFMVQVGPMSGVSVIPKEILRAVLKLEK